MQVNEQQSTRRRFMQTTGSAALALGLSGCAVTGHRNVAAAKRRQYGANDRLNIGIIGLGTITTNEHMPFLMDIRQEQNCDIRSICDLNPERLDAFADKITSRGGQALKIRDYREMLADKDIDYVVVATPEHSHAYIILDALNAGKHVYSEKPLTHTIAESFAVVKKARETGLKVQVGVQGMSDDRYAAACEAIKAGKIGTVVAAQIDYTRNYYSRKPPHNRPWRVGVDEKTPMPEGLDWNAWLKPAPIRPWSAPHYYEWRCYSNYSGGIATDLFIHRLTRILKACALEFPVRVAGMGGIYTWPDGRDLPDSMEMLLEYPKIEGITGGMTVHVLGTQANNYKYDHLIRGTEGTLAFTGNGWQIIAESESQEPKIIACHEKTGGEHIGLHHRNLQAAIRTNAPLACPPELGLYGVAAVCMGNESWFTKKIISWDARREKMVPA
ncbi:MAG: Gfo/Idh/MocA family oxidoreductase [Phycisphaerales bacterium]|nr:Gfo/Idh/MocA family oxidoreductase [Phycisphaerales bacterium]